MESSDDSMAYVGDDPRVGRDQVVLGDRVVAVFGLDCCHVLLLVFGSRRNSSQPER